MFYTMAQAESPMPAGLPSTRVRRWRAFNIPIDRPWFVATFKIGGAASSFKTTWAAASELELADLLMQHCDDDLIELHCYVPSRPKTKSTWSMRVGASVWRRPMTPDVIVIQDIDGEFFPGGRVDGPQELDLADRPLELIAAVSAFKCGVL